MTIAHDVPGDDEWRRRYETLIENAVDGMVLIDDRGTVVEFNPAAERLFGYAAHEAVGRNVAFLMPDDVAAEHDDYLRRYADTGEPHVIGTGRRVEGRRRDGGAIPLHLSVSPLDLAVGRHYLGVLRDLSVEVALQEALERQATHDHLTGLPNRALLLRRLDEELAHAEPGLLFLDLDGFKTLNDSRGHVVGDRLLAQVADRLRGVVAPTDLLARLGGDEFVVVRPERPGVAELESLAEELIDAVERPFDVEGGLVHLSVSIGIARGLLGTGMPITAVSLLRDADMAMYVAKADGRGRWRHVTDEHRRAAVDRHELVERLRRALDDGELVLHYQPQVHLGTRTTTSVEALVRWEHPHRGTLPPSAFLPQAEEAGLMGRIDAYVLDRAVRQAATWARDGAAVRVWVNTASCHLDESCVTDVAALVAETGCDPGLLGLEIAETQIMRGTTAPSVLGRLRELGVHLAVDDFGTGYSNFARLRHLPVDTLKLDRSLVATITEDDAMHHVVASVIELARGLGMQTVAEGIETPGQLACVEDAGVDLAQGYLLSRPAPADETTTRLRSSWPAATPSAAAG